MPPDDNVFNEHEAPGAEPAPPSPSWMRELFKVPGPIKRVFDQFPLLIYPANILPERTARRRDLPTLYILSTKADANSGSPSFNPSCLKWQTFLKFSDIDFQTTSSSNHASSNGVLPFLLPFDTTQSSSSPFESPIPSDKLQKWAQQHGATATEPSDVRYDAYLSLLDHRIRRAWLYFLYLEPANAAVVQRLYVDPSSTNPLVRLTIAHQLRRAAQTELLKQFPVIDVRDLYREADRAFEALSILLGDGPWFFDAEQPGLFDASVFAYTHLLLADGMAWKGERLVRAVRGRANLERHCERILSRYFHSKKR